MNNTILEKIVDFFYWLFVEKIHYVLLSIFVFWGFYIVFQLSIIPRIATSKAKNISNIQSSCLYLVSKYYSRQGVQRVVEVNGKKYHADGSRLDWGYLPFYEKEEQFPFYYKNKTYFNGDSFFWDKIVTDKNMCYEVKYITVLDLFFIDFIYLYDFEIPKKFQSNDFKPVQINRAN